MPVNILMPALSPTMEKGNLAKWLKKEGDEIKPGDVIAEIETDKATMEYEAIDEGTLAKIVVPEGTQDVPVNALIAVLAEEGEDAKAAAAAAGKRRSSRGQATGFSHEIGHLQAPFAANFSSGRECIRHRPCRGRGRAGRGRCNQSHLLFPARSSPRQASRYRPCAHSGFRSARPDHRARCGDGKIRQGTCGASPCRCSSVVVSRCCGTVG